MSKNSKYKKDTPEDNINAHEGGDINLIFELLEKIELLKEFHKNETIIGWKNLIEKKDFFTLSKQLIEMHYDPKYKNSNNYTEKSKIQKIHLDPNIKNNVSEVANLILEISNKI